MLVEVVEVAHGSHSYGGWMYDRQRLFGPAFWSVTEAQEFLSHVGNPVGYDEETLLQWYESWRKARATAGKACGTKD